MLLVPADTPVTRPVADPTVATPGVPELQVPPDGAPVNVVVSPSHMSSVPLMPVGSAFTVTVLVREQPVAVTV